MSVERADRTGPTGLETFDWKMAARRVMPPSTSSSTTMSASFSPIWGRAALELSILTIRATRLSRAASEVSTPVSGNTGGAVVVVVEGMVGATLVVGSTVVAAVFFFPPPPHPARARAATTKTTAERRNKEEVQ